MSLEEKIAKLTRESRLLGVPPQLITKGALTESEIRQIAKYYKLPIVSINTIYDFKTPKKDGCYILLISPSPMDNGHWVGLYKFGKNVLYHDTYACPPPEHIQDLCKKMNLAWTTLEIQDLRSQHCGTYVLEWLRNVYKSKDPYNITDRYLEQWHQE